MKGAGMLQVEKLSHGFAGKRLWTIEWLHWSGCGMVHLQGDNGSGKTTLLRVLAGLDAPDQGWVHWNLEGDMAYVPPCPGRVIYLHQSPYLFDTSVINNLRLAARWRGLARTDIREQTQRMLAWCGLEGHAQQRARSLSGGERLRLALARAWLLSPRVLLLDEPTANLDANAVVEVNALIDDLSRAGCAILLSSHHSSLLTERCRYYWRLQAGSLHQGVVG